MNTIATDTQIPTTFIAQEVRYAANLAGFTQAAEVVALAESIPAVTVAQIRELAATKVDAEAGTPFRTAMNAALDALAQYGTLGEDLNGIQIASATVPVADVPLNELYGTGRDAEYAAAEADWDALYADAEWAGRRIAHALIATAARSTGNTGFTQGMYDTLVAPFNATIKGA